MAKAIHLHQHRAHSIELGIVRQIGATLARFVAHVEPGEIAHGEGAHSHSEAFEGRVNLRRRAAIQQEHLRFTTVATEHAVADKAVANARKSADFADFLANCHCGSERVIRSLLTAHNFEQLHHISRAKEVHAENVLGSLGRGCDGIDILVRGVACEDGSRLTDCIELRKNFFLQLEILEYRFNHEVNIGEIRIVCRPADRAHALLHLRLGQLAFFHRDCVVLLDNAQAASERFVIDLNHDSGDADVGEAHRDTTAHRAAANDCDFFDVAQWSVTREVFDFRRLTLGKENVSHSRRLG